MVDFLGTDRAVPEDQSLAAGRGHIRRKEFSPWQNVVKEERGVPQRVLVALEYLVQLVLDVLDRLDCCIAFVAGTLCR